jgi:hypothetical protein
MQPSYASRLCLKLWLWNSLLAYVQLSFTYCSFWERTLIANLNEKYMISIDA